MAGRADADGRAERPQPGPGAGLVPVLQRYHRPVRQDAGRTPARIDTRNARSPPTCARCCTASITSTWPKPLISSRSKAPPPSRPSPRSWPAKSTCSARSKSPTSARRTATRGFWVIEQKAGNVTWQDVNSLVRPGVLRMFTYQLVSRGATAIVFFRWRQPRFGTEKFHGAVLPHSGRSDGRVFKEVRPIGRRDEAARAGAGGDAVCARTAAFSTATTMNGRCSSRTSPTSSSTCASISSSSTPRCTTAISASISRGRLKICRLQARLRAVAAPAGRRRGRPAQALRAERRHARRPRSTPAWWTNTIWRPTPAIRTI